MWRRAAVLSVAVPELGDTGHGAGLSPLASWRMSEEEDEVKGRDRLVGPTLLFRLQVMLARQVGKNGKLLKNPSSYKGKKIRANLRGVFG